MESISKSALECVKVLLGEIPPEMPALVAQPAAVRALHLVSEEQSRHWKSIQPTFTKQSGTYLILVASFSRLTIIPAKRTGKRWEDHPCHR